MIVHVNRPPASACTFLILTYTVACLVFLAPPSLVSFGFSSHEPHGSSSVPLLNVSAPYPACPSSCRLLCRIYVISNTVPSQGFGNVSSPSVKQMKSRS